MATAINTNMTIAQACTAFGVTSMCIHSWRRGTATKKPLPVAKQKPGDRRVFIPVDKARIWADKHGVEFAVDPVAVLADGSGRKKPGPKARIKH